MCQRKNLNIAQPAHDPLSCSETTASAAECQGQAEAAMPKQGKSSTGLQSWVSERAGGHGFVFRKSSSSECRLTSVEFNAQSI